MSRTTTVTVGSRHFWAVDDAFGVWLGYLVEEVGDPAASPDPWLGELAQRWRVAAVVTDYGLELESLTPEQTDRLRSIALAARQKASDEGDLSEEQLRRWLVVDDLPVAGGFSRTGSQVEVRRVLEVADGFVALLDGDLAPDPPQGVWLLGTGRGFDVMRYRDRPPHTTQP